MKILIISRNTWPLQSPRAFRTQELSEELARRGHEVILYTVQGKYDYSAYMKEKGLILRPIHNKHARSSNDGTGRMSMIDRIITKFFKRLLYYPDIEFMFRMKKIIQNEPNVDLLISIAQPHSIHWGCAYAKQKLGEKFPKVWIADCGDPFCGSPYGKWPKYMRYFEKKWCKAVNYITVPTVNSIKGYFPEFWNKIHVIPQGFDFSKTPISQYKPNAVPTFVFVGTIYPKRSPLKFMNFLLTLDIEYRFILYTKHSLGKEYLEKSNGKIEYKIGYGRKEIIKACSEADFLINIKNLSSVQTPSKLIDYGISQRPILEISSEFKEESDFYKFISGDYSSRLIINDLERYKIENVTQQFLSLVNL